MNGTEGEYGARLVWRVADAIEKTPFAVVEMCSRCSQRVLVDRLSTPDPPGTILVLVCVPCALPDPETRDGVLRTWAAARRLRSVLPPADKTNPVAGRKPGPAFKPVLAEALAAQDAGEFEDEAGAVAWLEAREDER